MIEHMLIKTLTKLQKISKSLSRYISKSRCVRKNLTFERSAGPGGSSSELSRSYPLKVEYISNSTYAEPANLFRPPQKAIHLRRNERSSLKSVNRRSNSIWHGLYMKPTYPHWTPEFHPGICPAPEDIPEIHCFAASRQKIMPNSSIVSLGDFRYFFKKGAGGTQ
jgi:hypothetical protein